MKRKPVFDLKKDLWVIIFDILSVNIAYFAAIVLRYYLRYSFIPEAAEYLKTFWKFAPIYTVVCIIVFLLFGLYNGMWIYASLRDLQRIATASIVASILYVIGSWAFFTKMPYSFYLVGAFFQLCLIVFIRYIYRIIGIEKQKAEAKKLPVQNMMIIGSGASAIKVLDILNNELLYKPVVIVDPNCKEKSIRGIPVAATSKDVVDQYKVNCTIITDPLLPNAKREEISILCSDKKIELYDYTGFMKSASGSVSLLDINRIVSGPVKIVAGGKTFGSAEEAMRALKGGYSVASVSGNDLTIELKPSGNASPSGEWIKKYEQESGEEVSFF